MNIRRTQRFLTLTGPADVFISERKKREKRLNSENQPRSSQKSKGGNIMLYLFLAAVRTILYELAVNLLRGACCA